MASFFLEKLKNQGAVVPVFTFHLRNYTTSAINYDLTAIPGTTNWVGKSASTLDGNGSVALSFSLLPGNVAIEGGSVRIVLGATIYARFWSGSADFGIYQYVNLLSGDTWNVTTDTAEMSAISNGSLQIWADGGGVKNPAVSDIYLTIQ